MQPQILSLWGECISERKEMGKEGLRGEKLEGKPPPAGLSCPEGKLAPWLLS